MSDDLVKSRLGYTYDLKDALRHNPKIIQAGDDICAVALTRIEALEAENARLKRALEVFADDTNWFDATEDNIHYPAWRGLVDEPEGFARAALQKETTND
jgi:hypothetical protein